jgi:acyl-CoA synthetase (AMP-forming)/AMP-acid ligase II
LQLLKVDPAKVQVTTNIPCLPVEVFKHRKVVSFNAPAQAVFSSSATTGATPSRHYLADTALYKRAFTTGFEQVYGATQQYRIFGLLPGYLERTDSSLVYMVNELIRRTKDPKSGFYLDEHQALADELRALPTGRMGMVIGVTHALLDFAERFTFDLPNLIVMETGGMKGRRAERTRPEVHQLLSSAFGCKNIHSEYGMTELLSQAYSTGDGRFRCPPWMKVLIRETDDPFAVAPVTKTGRIHIIDLANHYSCSFIATGDLGRIYDDGSFEVLGRFDHAEVRGCNLMID